MTDIDYKNLNSDIAKILANADVLVEGVDMDRLIALKKKLGMVKAIISDISKINDCCGKGTGLDPLMMMMMMNTVKDGSPEAITTLVKTLQDKINPDKQDKEE